MRGLTKWLTAILLSISSATARPAAKPGELSLIAATLVLEAGGEGSESMRLVAQVMRQRQQDLQVPFSEILTKRRNGFTPFYVYGSAAKVVEVGQRHPLFREGLSLAGMLLTSPELLGNETLGATHFDQVGSRAYWAKPKYETLRVRRLIFYRLQVAPNRKTYVFPKAS